MRNYLKENLLEIKTQCNQKLPDSIDRESFDEAIGNFTKIQIPVNNFKENVLRKNPQLHELVRIYSYFNGKKEITIEAYENFYRAADLAIRELDLTAWKLFWNDTNLYGYSAFTNNQSWFSHLTIYEKVQQIDNFSDHATRFTTCLAIEIAPLLVSRFQQQSNATDDESLWKQAMDIFSNFASIDQSDTADPFENFRISLDNAEKAIFEGLECSKDITNAIIAKHPEIHLIRKPHFSMDRFFEPTTMATTTISILSRAERNYGNGTWFGMSINKLVLFIVVLVVISIIYAVFNYPRKHKLEKKVLDDQKVFTEKPILVSAESHA